MIGNYADWNTFDLPGAVFNLEHVLAVYDKPIQNKDDSMALETLKGVEEIGGFKVVDMNAIRDEKIRPFNYIYVRHDVNSISFNIQNGPIKENGINGCQVVTMLETALVMINKLNEKFPCHENDRTIMNLNEAIDWQYARTKNRERRGVEGTSQI